MSEADFAIGASEARRQTEATSRVGQTEAASDVTAADPAIPFLGIDAAPAAVDAEAPASLLSVADVSERAGLDEPQIRAAIEQGDVFALGERSAPLIPVFQFVGSPPRVPEVVGRVVRLLQPVCADPATILTWFLTPKDDLGGAVPAEALSDVEGLELAARRDAVRLA